MVLTSRQKRIAHRLLNKSKVFRVRDLSEELSVSTRTVRNDLDKVSEWINNNEGCTYNSKPGKGIWISFASDFYQKKAINNLESIKTNEAGDNFYNLNERKWKVITLLEFDRGYHTGKEISSLTKVSINTMLSDLQTVSETLKPFDLKLKSRHYYGYTIQGREISHRNLMEYIIQKRINKYTASANEMTESLTLISFEANQDNEIPSEIRKYISNISLSLIDDIPNNIHQKSTEQIEIIKSMVNRLAIIVFSDRHGCYLKEKSRYLGRHDEFYKNIYKKIITLFNVGFRQADLDYFILGGRIYTKTFQADKLSKSIIGYVGKHLHISFQNNLKLQDALTQHLMMKINNHYQYMSEYTPFTDEVKSKFNILFKIVKSALQKYISKSPVVIDETFVTLISLHFLTAISELRIERKVRVLYVCSTGLGAASLLQRLVEGKIANIQAVGFASSTNYLNKIKELKPDLVISIFPLLKVSQSKVIQVNPIPTTDDIEMIRKTINSLENEGNFDNYLQESNLEIHRTRWNSEEEVFRIMSVALKTSIQLKNYLDKKISRKYKDAFLIHTQLTVVRIIFDQQYEFSNSEQEIKKFLPEDVAFVKTIFKSLNLEINNSETAALLRYTLLS